MCSKNGKNRYIFMRISTHLILLVSYQPNYRQSICSISIHSFITLATSSLIPIPPSNHNLFNTVISSHDLTFLYLSVYLSKIIHPTHIQQFIYPASHHPSIRSFINPSLDPHIHLFTHSSTHPSTQHRIQPLTYLSINLTIQQTIYQPTH